MNVESSIIETLKWGTDGKRLISITVGGEKISPEELNEPLFTQDVGTEIRRL